MVDCSVGRSISRPESSDGLDWTSPCPVPAENVLPFRPPLHFCSPHYESFVAVAYPALDRAGLIDHEVAGRPVDEFDELTAGLRLDDEGQ